MMASRYGNVEMIEYLIALGCNPRTQEDDALILSIDGENFGPTQFLIHLGCDPASQSFRAITLALEYDWDKIVKYLLSLLSRKDQYHLLPFINRKPQEFVNTNTIRLNKNVTKHNLLLVILKPKSLHMQMILIA
jgi:hypothetical protein